jgi:hypothetical protein
MLHAGRDVLQPAQFITGFLMENIDHDIGMKEPSYRSAISIA